MRGPLPLIAFLVSLIAFEARADETETCIRGAEQGYQLKRENKLVAAKQLLQNCAGATCPSALAPSCVEWLAEVEAALPSVVIDARDTTGANVQNLAVFVDGKPIASQLDGTAIAIDPGPHQFRFELGGVAQTQNVLILAGEKNRKIAVAFAGQGPDGPVADRAKKPRFSRAPAIVALVLGGISFDVAAVTGIIALVQKAELDDVCPTRQTCPASAADTVELARSSSIASTVALPLAGVGLGLGVLLWALSNPPAPSESVARSSPVSVEAMFGFGSAGIRGSF
jgi:hypothetical protein